MDAQSPHQVRPHSSSAPLPPEHRRSTVPLLPSGPGGVPVAKHHEAFLRKPVMHPRSRGTEPQRNCAAWRRAWIRRPRLSPPRVGAFGLQGTPNPPAEPGTTMFNLFQYFKLFLGVVLQNILFCENKKIGHSRGPFKFNAETIKYNH